MRAEQYAELSATNLCVVTERFQHPEQLNLGGGRFLEPVVGTQFDVSTFDERRTDTPFHAQFALTQRLGLRPEYYAQQQADTRKLTAVADMTEQLRLGRLARLAQNVVTYSVSRKHRQQIEEEQAALDALLIIARAGGGSLWVAGDSTPGSRHDKRIFAAPLVRAEITPDEVPRIQPVVLDAKGRKGLFPRELVLLPPRLFVLREVAEVA